MAEKVNLNKFFYPKSIAVIGASTKRGSLSWELINNLVKFGYQGRIFPINPKAEVIQCMKVYKSVTEIKEKIDLAIIMVSRNLVLQAIDECFKKKIDSILLITAGFKETGKSGASLEDEIVRRVNIYKMNLVGPNCMGIINMEEAISMNATFVRNFPISGGIAFVSQSGALGAAVLALLEQKDIGIIHFISIGNKADITENDVIKYWKDIDVIKVITVYLESFANSNEFLKVASEVTKIKPIIAIKAARTSSGQKAASSHTGALASSEKVVNTIFEQTGVIRVDTVEEMFDLAKCFDRVSLPFGNRLGILTNAGGPAILTADEADKWGLTLPPLTNATINKLKEFAPEEAALNNPVDLLPPATAEMYAKATELMLKDDNIDSLIIILGPPLMLDTLEIAKAISDATKVSKKTSILVLMSQDYNIPKLSKLDYNHPPILNSAESAARCIGRMYQYKLWKELETSRYKKFDENKIKTSKLVNVLKKGEYYLDSETTFKILETYGFPVIQTKLAKDLQESVSIAEEIGFPLVIKAEAKGLVHKTEVGAVITDIKNIEELVQAENLILSRLKEKELDKGFIGFLMQPFFKGDVETILGSFKDESAGHLIMFGMGGIFVEVYKDTSFRIAPVSVRDAELMINSIKGNKILSGIRGKKPVDKEFIKENILRLSSFVCDFPEFIEIDFNPFIVSYERDRCKILDARIKFKN
ncbi:MAG: acetate--CoA ligase family protein [Ignavibacteria bacterium]|nr:acetate--CoA ligase family protein [Ignavibacteria bacterium]